MEDSDFTSIQARIAHYHQEQSQQQGAEEQAESIELMPCDGDSAVQKGIYLPISWQDYQALVEWTGRAIREDKKGTIPDSITSMLDRVCLNGEQWLPVVQGFERCFTRVAGSVANIHAAKGRLGKQWLQGVGKAKQIYFKPGSGLNGTNQSSGFSPDIFAISCKNLSVSQ